jgi:hypothetical protein
MSGPITLANAKTAPRRHDVADDRLRQGHQSPGTRSLHGAERDELPHVVRESGQHRPGDEDADRELEDVLASGDVAEFSVKRDGDRRCQQVRGDDPRQMVEPTEVADDRRQSSRHDRLVQRGEQHAGHEAAVDDEDLLVRELEGGPSTVLIAIPSRLRATWRPRASRRTAAH